MRLLLKAALAVSLLANPAPAQPADDWVLVKAGNAFSFQAPPDLRAVPVQGIDSFVGRYESARFAMIFDFGAYSNDLSEARNDPNADVEVTTIDGRRAVIVTSSTDSAEDDCTFEVDLYVVVKDGAPPPVGLNISACANGYAGVVQLRRLYDSIRFFN